MPAPTPNTGGRPADLKQSDLKSNSAWQTNSGGRHHIFLFDGTWNDDTGVNPTDFTWDQTRLVWVSREDPSQAFPPIVSNLVKTNHALGPDSATQITHYFRGVGNDDENDVVNQTAEGAFATMEEHVRNSAYCTFLQPDRQGDQGSIFGFSRGAASARLVARDLAARGFVDKVTIGSRYCRVRNSGDLRLDVWDLVLRWSTTLIPGNQMPIAFLGVWDTVPTNVPATPADWVLPATVARAVHCMALRFIWKNWDSALAAQNLPALTWRSDLAAQYVSTDGLPWLRHQASGLTADLGGVSPRVLTPCNGGRPRVHPSVEQFVQHGGLQFCIEGDGFPPVCTISSPVYQPLAYPGADQVELYDSTDWA